MQHININPIRKLSTSTPSTINQVGVLSPVTVVETYHDGNNWYRKYSDGWIEQGGYESISSMTQYGTKTITFITPFQTTCLNVHCGIEISGVSGRDAGLHGIQDVSTIGFTWTNGDQATTQTGIYWTAKGI
ncbi:MAG: hypothetical protein IJG38_07620 [Thermoguttaceae bacterium]|nr:hypothetical protein [Thermoguttaceae bacterium]